MSVRTAIVLLLALSTITLLVGCGSSTSTPTPVAPPTGGFSNSNLNGTYVFSVSGTDTAGAPYAILGTLAANGSGGNGNGGITGGTIDIVDAEFVPAYDLSINSNGFYSVGVDGRGQATIGTATANPFGDNLTFDFVLSSSSHGLITEFDGNGSSSGTLDLQTAGITQASLAGSYAFSFSGIDPAGTGAFANVGAFTLDANGNASGVEDFNDSGLAYPEQSLSGQVILGPSATPATTLIATAFPLTFDVYAIDATHLKFIEIGSLPILSGDAFSQPSTTIPAGTMAFTLAGALPAYPASVLGGFMVTDGAGNITSASTEDLNEFGSVVSSAPVSFSAIYTLAGTGRYTLTNFTGFIGGTEYAAYPSSGGLLLLEIDNSGIMAGAAYPQTAGATFGTSEGYGLSLSGYNLGDQVEVDDIAEFTADSTGATVTGLIDENYPGAAPPFFGQALSGTYAGPDSSGRYELVAATGNTNSPGTLNGGFGLTFYTVDGTTFPFIESDSGQVATGVFVLQNPAAVSAAAPRSHMFIVKPLMRPHAAKKK
jgi:hypothetical protein